MGLGLVYTLAVIFWAPKIATVLGVMDHPGAQDHKKHVKSTPLVGGLAAIPPAMAMLAYVHSATPQSDVNILVITALFVAGIGSMLVGFFDDRGHIPALNRLFYCAVNFLLAIAIAPEFSITTLDIQGLKFSLQLGFLAVPFTILCLLAFQNAVNMADGRNGLVAGLTVIWLVNLLSYMPGILIIPLFALTLGMVLVAAANIGGRLFLGDAGTYGIGAIIGLSTIWAHQQNIGLHTIDIVIMFFFPICDMLRLILLRILDRRHPFSADHHHLHHYLDHSVGWFWGRKFYIFAAGLPILLKRVDAVDEFSGLGLAVILYITLFLTSYLGRRHNGKFTEQVD